MSESVEELRSAVRGLQAMYTQERRRADRLQAQLTEQGEEPLPLITDYGAVETREMWVL